MAPDFSIKSIPPAKSFEVQLVIPNFANRFIRNIQNTKNEQENVIYSDWKELPSVKFRLMVHPLSRQSSNSGRDRRMVAAFVETAAKSDYPEDWWFPASCKFHIYAINATDYRRSHFKFDSFCFSSEECDRGWHHFISYQELIDEQFLTHPNGDFHMRAACIPMSAAVSRSFRLPCPPIHESTRESKSINLDLMNTDKDGAFKDENPEFSIFTPKSQIQGGDELSPKNIPQISGSCMEPALNENALEVENKDVKCGYDEGLGRNGTGYIGLRNHGATCYMNALLQSLYFIGRFRQAVYSMSFDIRTTCGRKSVEILEKRQRRRKRSRGSYPQSIQDAVNPRDTQCPSEHAVKSAIKNVKSDDEFFVSSGDVSTVNMDVEYRSKLKSNQMLPSDQSDNMLYDEQQDSTDDDLSDLDEQELRDLLTEEDAERHTPPSVSLALQNLFFQLFTAKESVPCKELIRSFGWDAADAFTQQDTHELLKLLLDKVEEQMRGTQAEQSVKAMFEGEMETYIECINVSYKSVRKEAFEDLNLDVNGIPNIRASLQRLVMPEILDGDNMYDAEQHGKQPAKKGVRFIRFPPVCIFLLKRFDFDYGRMDTVKVFDRFEFDRELDLGEFCPDAGVYELHSVSVHQGDVNSGHYYCFLRPPPRTNWVKFDDDKVYHVSEYAAIGDNFGGEEPDSIDYLRGDRRSRCRPKPYNAYILVYVKKLEASRLLTDCSPLQVNPQVVSRCRTEDQLRQLRAKIRRIVEQRVKVKVYYPLQFKYRRFTELSLANIPPLFEIKSNRRYQIVPLRNQITDELYRLLHGMTFKSNEDKSASGSPSSNNLPLYVLHLMNMASDSPRFEIMELMGNQCLGEFLCRKVGESLPHRHYAENRYDACLHILAVPEKASKCHPASVYDEYIRSHSLLFIKYFESLKKCKSDQKCLQMSRQDIEKHKVFAVKANAKQIASSETESAKEEDNVICLDIISFHSDSKLRDLEPHVYRLLLQAMQDQVISPHQIEDIQRVVSTLPSNLPPLSTSSPYPSPLPAPLSPMNGTYPPLNWSIGVSAAPLAAVQHYVSPTSNLTCCLELDPGDKVETCILAQRKSLSQNKVFSGDVLVWSLELPEFFKNLKEVQTSQLDIGYRAEDYKELEEYVPEGSNEGHALLEKIIQNHETQLYEGFSIVSNNKEYLPPFISMISADAGGYIPPLPPQLPLHICGNFVDYSRELQSKQIYQFRFYNILECLNRRISSCGSIIHDNEQSGLIADSSMGLASSVASLGDLSSTSCISPVDTIPNKTVDGEDEDVEDDIWLHMPRARPILIRNFELNGRLPCKQVLMHVAWYAGVDPTHLHIYPEPPLLSDRRFEPTHIDALSVLLPPESRSERGVTHRQLALEEVYIHLEKSATWPGRLERRRSLVSAAAASGNPVPRILHLCVIPRHYRLCSRIIDAQQLQTAQQQQLQKLLRIPLSPAALSPGVPTPVYTMVSYFLQVFNKHVESIACVNSIIPLISPIDNKPTTAKDLVYDALERLPEEIAQVFRHENTKNMPLSTNGLKPLSLSLSDAFHFEKIPLDQPLQHLSLYTPPGSRQRDTIHNILAVPFRLEPMWSEQEEEEIKRGNLKVLLVVHQTPNERESFGYPFELLVRADASLSVIKNQVKEKLNLSKSWKNCTFFQSADGIRSWKGPNDVLDWNKHSNITLIAEHSAPYSKNRSQAAMRIA